MCSSSTDRARSTRLAACMGIASLSVSRPAFVNTTRRSKTWHAEQMNVWCSTPRTVAVSSGTTFVGINSAPQAAHRTLDEDFGHRTSWRRYSSLPVCSLSAQLDKEIARPYQCKCY
jgi:hypothetical protein